MKFPFGKISPVVLLAIVLLTVGVPLSAQELEGDLYGELGPGTFSVVGDCFVPGGETLEIAAGTTLNMEGWYRLTVQGTLNVYGEADAPVVFQPAPGREDSLGWGGMRFLHAEQSSLVHCRIFGAVSGGNPPDCFGGAVYLNDSGVSFENCIFEGNTARRGGGIYAYASEISFTGCEFQNNNATEEGGGLYLSSATASLERCIVSANRAESAGGGIYLFFSSPLITHVTLGQNSAPSGAGIYNRYSSMVLSQSIVYGSLGGEGLYAESGGYSGAEYCDFFGNEGGNFAGEGIHMALGLLLMVNANGDSCDIYKNILLDPRFAGDPESEGWRLSWISPCIDAGDPTDPPDPDGSVADIGAVTYDPAGVADAGSEPPATFVILETFPNPFNPVTTIKCVLPENGVLSLRVFDLEGRIISRLAKGEFGAGVYRFAWNGREASGQPVASGTYFIALAYNGKIITRRVTLLR